MGSPQHGRLLAVSTRSILPTTRVQLRTRVPTVIRPRWRSNLTVSSTFPRSNSSEDHLLALAQSDAPSLTVHIVCGAGVARQQIREQSPRRHVPSPCSRGPARPRDRDQLCVPHQGDGLQRRHVLDRHRQRTRRRAQRDPVQCGPDLREGAHHDPSSDGQQTRRRLKPVSSLADLTGVWALPGLAFRRRLAGSPCCSLVDALLAGKRLVSLSTLFIPSVCPLLCSEPGLQCARLVFSRVRERSARKIYSSSKVKS